MVMNSNSNDFIKHKITFYIEEDGTIEISDFPIEFSDMVLKLTKNQKKP